MCAMSRLPVRTGADVHLADAFEADGCPLCRELDRAEDACLRSLLDESVNDVGFRADLDAGRGFCRVHARAILDTDRRRSGSLGAAILLRASLVARLRDLDAIHDARGWVRARRTAEAARLPACPVCARLDRTESGLLGGLPQLVNDDAWATAVARAPFCLDHVVALLARRPAVGWGDIEIRQLERLRDLRDTLERFAHASSQDRAHLQTDEQRASVDLAADVLGTRRRRRPQGRPSD